METCHPTPTADEHAAELAGPTSTRGLVARPASTRAPWLAPLEQGIYHPAIVLPLLELQQLTATSDLSVGSVLWALFSRGMRLALDSAQQRYRAAETPLSETCCNGHC